MEAGAVTVGDAGDGVTTPRGLFAYEGATDTAVAGPITPSPFSGRLVAPG